MSTKDFSNTTRLRRKIASITSAYYNANLDTSTVAVTTRKEQTSAQSGEVVVLRRQGCAPCRADNESTYPSNERNPGGR
jgi:hypothetical protein